MSAFGEQLREARRSQGIALEEIAASTKISRHHLEALEEGRLDRLPGGAFNKGFVRAYAEFLGLDAGDAVEDYLREERAQGLAWETDGEAVLRAMARHVDRGSHLGGGLLAGPALRALLIALPFAVAAAAGAWWLLLRAPSPAEPTPAASSPSAPAEPVAPARTVPTATRTEAPAPDPGQVPPEDATGTPPVPVQAAPAPREPGPGPASPVDAPAPRQDDAPAAATPGEAPLAEARSSSLSVTESGVGMDVIDRTLVGPRDEFREGTLAWFWTRVVGGADGDMVEHVWLQEGSPVARHDVRVGGPHWRVYTRHTLLPGSAGAWAVEARDASGRVLARKTFQVLPG